MSDEASRLSEAVRKTEIQATRLEVITNNLKDQIEALPCREHVRRMSRIESEVKETRTEVSAIRTMLYYGGGAAVVLLGILWFFQEAILRAIGAGGTG